MPDTHTHERRHFTRILLGGEVKLCSNNDEWETDLLDISLKGALLQRPETYQGEPGHCCRIEVSLAPQQHLITMQGNITHLAQGHIGFRCEEIDIDSISHLKRLVELHLGNPLLLERELSELLISA